MRAGYALSMRPDQQLVARVLIRGRLPCAAPADRAPVVPEHRLAGLTIATHPTTARVALPFGVRPCGAGSTQAIATKHSHASRNPARAFNRLPRADG